MDANDVPTVRGLMADGNPTPVSTNGKIWIEPGTKTTLYADANAYAGQTVLVAVVEQCRYPCPSSGCGFVPFHLELRVGGSGKYIQGYFESGLTSPGSLPGGPDDSALTPPDQRNEGRADARFMSYIDDVLSLLNYSCRIFALLSNS